MRKGTVVLLVCIPSEPNNVKTKKCALCQDHSAHMFRIQRQKGKNWIFCCKACTEEEKTTNPHYRYGGTWKG